MKVFVISSLLAYAEGRKDAISPRSFSAFAKNLAMHLAPSDGPASNYVCAPYGVNQMLGLLSLGANGKTLTRIREVLELGNASDAEFKNLYTRINSRHIEDGKQYGLSVAVGLWIKGTNKLKPAFESDAKEIFAAKIQEEDNLAGKEEAINTWVSDKTGGTIKNLFKPSSFKADTVLVAVHAIHLKAKWDKPFELVPDGAELKFLVRANGGSEKEVKTPFMRRKDFFEYAELGNGAKVVSIPFKLPGEQMIDRETTGFKMLFYLPESEEAAVRTMEHLPTAEQRQKLDVGEGEVEVTLPKFKFETTVKRLKNVLKKNMKLPIFEGQGPDFGNIFQSGQGPEVSDIIQKAAIEVDELGAEASAATGFEIVPFSADFEEPIKLHFNRPFGFQIIDAELNLELFRGYVEDPSSASSGTQVANKPADKEAQEEMGDNDMEKTQDMEKSQDVENSQDVETSLDAEKSLDVEKSQDVENSLDVEESLDVKNSQDVEKSQGEDEMDCVFDDFKLMMKKDFDQYLDSTKLQRKCRNSPVKNGNTCKIRCLFKKGFKTLTNGKATCKKGVFEITLPKCAPPLAGPKTSPPSAQSQDSNPSSQKEKTGPQYALVQNKPKGQCVPADKESWYDFSDEDAPEELFGLKNKNKCLEKCTGHKKCYGFSYAEKVWKPRSNRKERKEETSSCIIFNSKINLEKVYEEDRFTGCEAKTTTEKPTTAEKPSATTEAPAGPQYMLVKNEKKALCAIIKDDDLHNDVEIIRDLGINGDTEEEKVEKCNEKCTEKDDCVAASSSTIKLSNSAPDEKNNCYIFKTEVSLTEVRHGSSIKLRYHGCYAKVLKNNPSSRKEIANKQADKKSRGCYCKDFVNKKGYGNCKKEWPANKGLGCYIQTNSDCPDAKPSITKGLEAEKWSNEACKDRT